MLSGRAHVNIVHPMFSPVQHVYPCSTMFRLFTNVQPCSVCSLGPKCSCHPTHYSPFTPAFHAGNNTGAFGLVSMWPLSARHAARCNAIHLIIMALDASARVGEALLCLGSGGARPCHCAPVSLVQPVSGATISTTQHGPLSPAYTQHWPRLSFAIGVGDRQHRQTCKGSARLRKRCHSSSRTGIPR